MTISCVIVNHQKSYDENFFQEQAQLFSDMRTIMSQGNNHHDIRLEAKVEFLKRPESYPDRPRKVETVETHMSWVFLTENYAYKLKKPVRYEFLDFSSVDSRHHDCEEEIRLNRRLARDVYIGVLPLTADAAGNMRLGEDIPPVDIYPTSKASERGKLHPADKEMRMSAVESLPKPTRRKGAHVGTRKCQQDRARVRDSEHPGPTRAHIIDWLVKMRRLPAEKMLDHAIKHRTVREAEITKFALMLANFYKESPSIEISPSEYRQRFETDIQENLRELTTPVYGLPIDLPTDICKAQLEFLKRKSELFARRVQEQRIIEAHGDLRPEHICLGTEPLIIDSLEFKREFRILDPADELSFLTLECERLGAPPFVSDLIFDTYIRITGDTPHEDLVHFYKSCRAGLRAKLAIRHLREPEMRDTSKWRNLAMTYLHMADAHIREASPER